MTRLLIDEPPIAISPTLIRVLGGHDLACFAQQVHFVAMSHLGRERDGYRWAVCSAAEWCDLVVLTSKQAKRVIGVLVDLGVIIRYTPRGSHDRTAWTRIDHEALERLRSGTDASVPNGTARTGRNRTAPTVPRGTDDPLSREGENTQESGAASSATSDQLELGQPVLTTNQIANKMQRGFWTWVEQQTGHAPLSIKPVGFQRLMAHFIDAGCTRESISCAVKELHRRGAPITQATIEAQMDGRRSTPRNGRPAVEQQLDALQYDAQGNLVAQ